MDETATLVRTYYDSAIETEWNRIANRPEFLLTCRMLDRYIKPGDTVIDIGGGPGRYSLYLANKGCQVTLFDLSAANIDFALHQAKEQNLEISAIAGDAREADSLVTGQFDHVLLMGPLYHLLDEAHRTTAVNAALNLLKPSGVLFASFINVFSGLIWAMKLQPGVVDETESKPFLDAMLENRSYAGMTFTSAYFATQGEILPFMAQFPLDKLHFFGQESITSPCESNIMAQPKHVVDLWLDICEKLWEREDLLSWSEHFMYVGRKQ
ncbi:MAG: methyltransferase domain-containing protein [Propionibacteriaceae bacterium]|nr:methyltransferase domain-containing protein [Propionibacteriaceae bacterium]